MRKTLSEQRKEEKLLYSFFGDGGYTVNRNGEITVNQLVGLDNVIIETPDVRRAFFSENSVGNVLVVGKHNAVYLKPWQTLRVKYKDSDGKEVKTYLVRIRKDRLRPYNFPDYNIVDIGKDGGFSGFEDDFSRSLNFDYLRMTAERQNQTKRKYKVIS